MPSSEILLFGFKQANYLAANLDLQRQLKVAFPDMSWRLTVGWVPGVAEILRAFKVWSTVDGIYFSNEIGHPHSEVVAHINEIASHIRKRADMDPAIMFARGYDGYGQYFKQAGISISYAPAPELLHKQWQNRTGKEIRQFAQDAIACKR